MQLPWFSQLYQPSLRRIRFTPRRHSSCFFLSSRLHYQQVSRAFAFERFLSNSHLHQGSIFSDTHPTTTATMSDGRKYLVYVTFHFSIPTLLTCRLPGLPKLWVLPTHTGIRKPPFDLPIGITQPFSRTHPLPSTPLFHTIPSIHNHSYPSKTHTHTPMEEVQVRTRDATTTRLFPKQEHGQGFTHIQNQGTTETPMS